VSCTRGRRSSISLKKEAPSTRVPSFLKRQLRDNTVLVLLGFQGIRKRCLFFFVHFLGIPARMGIFQALHDLLYHPPFFFLLYRLIFECYQPCSRTANNSYNGVGGRGGVFVCWRPSLIKKKPTPTPSSCRFFMTQLFSLYTSCFPFEFKSSVHSIKGSPTSFLL